MAKWSSIFIRVAGTFNPLTAALVQLQSELDSAQLADRIRRLEEPLRDLHPDLPEVGRILYDVIKATGDAAVTVNPENYLRLRRCFALLEHQGYVASVHCIGSAVPLNVRVSDPAFMLYLAGTFESETKLDALFTRVDTALPGSHLDGAAIASDLELPIPVVAALFRIFEAKGFGFCSNEVGRVSYYANA